ncbi:MAG TPA: amphi-Trp domain-containing protein [Dehalococcoidia bacterium]|jgi:amphi-Trp domain-containing protein|nr:amphi-Trp domain-containing protein [Dehalococcoidia bacterium]
MAKKARDDSRYGSRQAARFTDDLDTEAAAAHLEAIAKALRDNRLIVEADETLDVLVGSRVLVDLKAQAKGGSGKASLEVSLRWNAPANPGTLSISSGATPDDEKLDDKKDDGPAEPQDSPETASPTWTPE